MFVSINYIFIKNLFEAAYVRTFCDEILFQGVRFRWEHFASLIGKLMLIGLFFQRNGSCKFLVKKLPTKAVFKVFLQRVKNLNFSTVLIQQQPTKFIFQHCLLGTIPASCYFPNECR